MMTYSDIKAFDRMDAAQRKVVLGIGALHHLPAEGAPFVIVHGIKLWCEPKGLVPTYKRQRVRALCPVCHREFAAGNLAQHHMIHTEAGRERLATKARFAKERRAKWGW